MRREANIQRILPTDNKNELIGKLNSNFMGVHYLSGGNLGDRGPTGPTGPLGFPGFPGPTGNDGVRGTRWFIGDFQPQGGLGDVVIEGDYWINTGLEYNPINEFTSSGWNETEYSLLANSEFKKIDNIERTFAAAAYGVTGATAGATAANVILYKKDPEVSTFNFSDSTLDGSNANPFSSLFTVSYDGLVSQGSPLIEFSRGDISTGQPSDYLRHPYIGFVNPGGNNSDLLFLVPQDKFTLSTLDTTGSVDYSLNMNVAENVSFRSSGPFALTSSSSASNGFKIVSKGSASLKTNSTIRPTYTNFGFTSGLPQYRIDIYNRVEITSESTSSHALSISSRVDTSTGGEGTLSVDLGGGLFDDTAQEHKPDNYAMRIKTLDGDSNATERFSITSAGSIYTPKVTSGYSYIYSATNNVDNGNNRSWFLLGNRNYTSSSGTGSRQVSFGANKNEIVIRPIGIPSGYDFSVGLILTDVGDISYLGNLKNIGESLKLRILVQGSSLKCFGITSINDLSAGGADTFVPVTQVYTFDNGVKCLEVTITKEVSGFSAGDLVTFSGDGVSGRFYTTT